MIEAFASARVASARVEAAVPLAIFSSNQAAVAVSIGQAPGDWLYSLVAELIQHPGFIGTKTATVVVGDSLRLNAGLFDDETRDIDSCGDFDSIAGYETFGEYEFDAVMDMLTVARRRVVVDIENVVFGSDDEFDSRPGKIDSWGMFDGLTSGVTVLVYVATTEDDPLASPTWSPWIQSSIVAARFRAAKFRIEISSDSYMKNTDISRLVARGFIGT